MRIAGKKNWIWYAISAREYARLNPANCDVFANAEKSLILGLTCVFFAVQSGTFRPHLFEREKQCQQQQQQPPSLVYLPYRPEYFATVSRIWAEWKTAP
jgi:hypothetical protein